MTDEFLGLNLLNLSVLLVVVLDGSSYTLVHAVDRIANVTGYHVAGPSQALSSSPMAVTRHGQTNEKVQKSSENHDTSAVVNLVEAPVEVIGPRVVESGGPREKVERKRESRIGTDKGSRNLGYGNKIYACVLRDDVGPKEVSHEVKSGETEDDSMGVVRASEKRDASSGISDEGEDEEYDNDESGGSETVDDEDEDEDDDDDANGVVVEDDKKRRNLSRKAGRHYRQGPKIWDQWGKWTSCSVSCGAGKLTRWRHCVAGGCSLGEKEAQLKTCTFSAC